MACILALSGISGAGKTYTREHDPRLKDLPYVDIADIYAEHPLGLLAPMALHLMLNRAEELIEAGEQTIVLEAYFRRGSKQREWLEYVAERVGATVEYIELDTPIEVCCERVLAAWKAVREKPGVTEEELQRAERFYEARITILEDIANRG